MEKTGDFLLQLYATSPAPKRDYHGLTITNKYIILNSWDISRGSHVYPRRKRFLLEEFLTDRHYRNDVSMLFGPHVLDYIEKISRKDKSLYSLSEVLFRKLLQYLAVNDIIHLRQTSKIFFQICNSNSVWQIIFQKKMKRPATLSELKQAEIMSWCHILRRKIQDSSNQKKIFETFKIGIEKLQHRDSAVAKSLLKHSKIKDDVVIHPLSEEIVKKISSNISKAGSELNAKSTKIEIMKNISCFTNNVMSSQTTLPETNKSKSAKQKEIDKFKSFSGIL